MAGTNRSTLEHTAERTDHYDEREDAREDALDNFLKNVNDRNPELFKDIVLAESKESDKSQLSWIKNNGTQNSSEIYKTIKEVLEQTPEDDREYLIDTTVHALLNPTAERIDPGLTHELRYADQITDGMTKVLADEQGTFKDFDHQYHRLARLQDLHYTPQTGEETKTYREILKEHGETLKAQ